MFRYFNTTKFDDKITVFDGIYNYTFSDIKKIAAFETENIKNKKENG